MRQTFSIVVLPCAASPATASAVPALKSAAHTHAPVSVSTPFITATLPSVIISAPSRQSSRTWRYLFSKIFSIITLVPCATLSIAMTAAWESVGKPGYGIVRTVCTLRRRTGAEICTLFSPQSTLHPACSNTGMTGVICSARVSKIRTSPPVTAAAAI